MTILLLLFFLGSDPAAAAAAGRAEVRLEKGIYQPFFRDQGERDRDVGPLFVDRFAVTNSEFLEFVRNHPRWRRSAIKAIFAEKSYLSHWTGDLSLPKGSEHRPVTNVSWFVARKFCENEGKRLPRVAEWEYAADGQNPKNLEIILAWYGDLSAAPSDVRKTPANALALHGMHGQIWEWVDDYSSVIMAGDSRSSNDTSKSMFCGSGSLRAKDPAQYATFMRFAHRSSLKAEFTGASLGFRCVRDAVAAESKGNGK